MLVFLLFFFSPAFSTSLTVSRRAERTTFVKRRHIGFRDTGVVVVVVESGGENKVGLVDGRSVGLINLRVLGKRRESFTKGYVITCNDIMRKGSRARFAAVAEESTRLFPFFLRAVSSTLSRSLSFSLPAAVVVSPTAPLSREDFWL